MRLGQIFEKQDNLQKTIGYDFFMMTDDQRAAYIKEYWLHADHEAHEMLAELPYFKPWSKKSNNMSPEQRKEAFDKAKEEFVDVFHFVINIALALRISPQELFAAYVLKNDVNHDRQKEGY